MEESHIYSLDNSNNYKYELIYSSTYIFKIYVDILNSYITEFNSIKLIYTKNINLYYYLFDKGVNTIAHIFKILLVNTKNVDLVKYYCIKSINYYIEFIEQNNRQAEDKIKYTHASLFSYGSTIYKLNKSYRKTSLNILDETVSYIIHNNEENELSIFKNIDLMIDLYNKQISDAIHTNSQSGNIQDLVDYSILLMEKLVELYPENDSLCEVNFDFEIFLSHRLNFVIDFISLINISSINILFSHIREKNSISLNKAILLKKILNKEEKFNNEEDYIKWLLL
jgi:hypothetical protein